MTRGRLPKPAGLREAQGDPGKRGKGARAAASSEATPSTPAAPPASPLGKPPVGMGRDARRIWFDLQPQLATLRFIRGSDAPAFARYCKALADYWTVTKQLDRKKHTYVTKSAHGTLTRVNPLFLVQDRLERRLMAHEDRFGLSPQARQAILLRLAAVPPSLPLDPQPDPAGKQPDHGDSPQANESPIGILGGTRAVH